MSKKLVITIVVAVAVLAIIIGYARLAPVKFCDGDNCGKSVEKTQIGTTKLTLDTLKNGTYTWNLITEGLPFKFIDGIYLLPPLPGESQEDYFVKLDTNHIAFGDLNNDGQEDAAVILVSRAGGTGTYREIAVVLNHNGIGDNIAGQYLGDRTTIHSLTINKSGVISVEMTPWEGGSGIRKIATYKLSGNKIIEID